ncbi:MAG: sigma-70 family RNA polymerase sigma factor [Verrucomicrobia bacterium]|nr:sigma-70 family RNA polymerase sigma factor [Verrucomicrobiota bacterium]
MDDRELLQRWVAERSEAAFADLVRRHIGLVYGSAMRQVRDPELARDITQAVFVLLAQKAASLNAEVVLSGWLLRTASYVASRIQRSESRRRLREQASLVMNDPTHRAPDDAHLWEDVAPHLDAALVALSTADRDAVVLRYFEQLPVREVGVRLGLSEEATKKRLQRALEKLRQAFHAKGVLVTLIGLSSLLSHVPAQSVPTVWVDQVVQNAISTTTAPLGVSLVERWSEWWRNSPGWLPWAGVTVALLLSVGWWWRPHSASSGSSAPSSLTSADTASLDPSDQQTGRQYRLTALSAATGEPLLASIHWEIERDGEILATGEGETSSAGVWSWTKPEREFDSLTVWVAARKHGPRRSIWHGHELAAALPNETFLLEPGTELRGQVVDSEGKPVAGARIQLDVPRADPRQTRQRPAFHPRVHALVSDEDGRFQTDWVPRLENQRLNLYADHPEFVPHTTSIGGTGGRPADPRLVLSRGGWVSGQVVSGAEAHPAPHVSLTFNSKATPGERQVVADELGHFKVGPFPPGPVRLRVEMDGFIPISSQFEMPEGPKELQVYLPSNLETQNPETSSKRVRLRIRGSVTDALTGQPIPRFRVSSAEQFLGEGADGTFDWTVSLVRQDQYSLEIEADGYLAAATPERVFSADSEEISVQLTAGREIRGTVVDHAKRPMEGVLVALLGGNVPASLSTDGGLTGTVDRTLTDFAGRFSFPPNADGNRVFALAASGTAAALIGESPELTLEIQPWGMVEGQWNSTATNVSFLLESGWDESMRGGMPRVNQFYAALLDKGRFHFDRVPVGVFTVISQQMGESSVARTASATVRVNPGSVSQVELTPHNREVLVQVTADSSDLGSTWDHGNGQLMPVAQYRHLHQAASDPPLGIPRLGEFTLLDNMFGSDGKLRFDLVPAGQYVLTLRLYGKVDPEKPGQIPVVAEDEIQITVPVAEPNDDTAFVLPIKMPLER